MAARRRFWPCTACRRRRGSRTSRPRKARSQVARLRRVSTSPPLSTAPRRRAARERQARPRRPRFTTAFSVVAPIMPKTIQVGKAERRRTRRRGARRRDRGSELRARRMRRIARAPVHDMRVREELQREQHQATGPARRSHSTTPTTSALYKTRPSLRDNSLRPGLRTAAGMIAH